MGILFHSPLPPNWAEVQETVQEMVQEKRCNRLKMRSGAGKSTSCTDFYVKNGNIVPASGTLEEAAVCSIAKAGRRGRISSFLLEEGTVNNGVYLSVDYLRHVSGTPMNDELAGVFAKILHFHCLSIKLLHRFQQFPSDHYNHCRHIWYVIV